MSGGRERPLVICVTGAECTGKTTLAEHLARSLDVPLVPEVARGYLAGKHGYESGDVLAIAQAQLAAELAALSETPLVVADTDLTVIQVWWEEKYGPLHPWIAEALEARTPRRYLLPAPDLPWEFDPLRESPHDRPRLHARYREVLEASGYPYVEVEGQGDGRLERGLAQVRAWLNQADRGLSRTSPER